MLSKRIFLCFYVCFLSIINLGFSQNSISYPSIIVNELNLNPYTGHSFIELLVPNYGEFTQDFVDLSGWFIDNYSHNYEHDESMLRLGNYFSAVKPGTLIVLYDGDSPHPSINNIASFQSFTIEDQIEFISISSDKIEIIAVDEFEKGKVVIKSNTGWESTLGLNASNNGVFIWNPNGQIEDGIAWMNSNIPYGRIAGVTNLGNGLPQGPFSITAGTICHDQISVEVGSGLIATPGFSNNSGNSNAIGQHPQSLSFSISCGTFVVSDIPAISQGQIEILGGQAPYDVEVRNSFGNLHHEETTLTSLINVDGNPGESYEVTVVDSRGCKETCNFSLAETTEIFNICKGQQVRIGKDINPDCFKWEPEEGLIFPSNPFPKAAPEETTTYTLMISDGCGAITERHKYKVVVQDVQDLEIITSSNSPVMTDQNIVLSTTGEWENYQWFGFPGTAPTDQTTITLTPLDFYNYLQGNSTIYAVNTTDDAGCSNQAQIEIFADPCKGADKDGDGICDGEDENQTDPCIPNGDDTDGDGICDGEDCDALDPLMGIGLPCNDGNPCTINDAFDINCNCIGENISIGQLCDDQNDCTINDSYDSNCNCVGQSSLDFSIIDVSETPCTNGLVILSIDREFAYYRWYDAASSLISEKRTLNAFSPGLYYAEVFDEESCSEKKFYRVEDFSRNGLEITSNGTVLCGNGDELELSIGDGYSAIVWQDDTGTIVGTNNVFISEKAGSYFVNATTINGCVLTGEKTIESSMAEFSFEPAYPILCSGQELELEVISENTSSSNLVAKWSDESVGFSKFVNEPGIYSVTITDENQCTISHEFEVKNENFIDIEAILLQEGFQTIPIRIISVTLNGQSDNRNSNSTSCSYDGSQPDTYEIEIVETGEIINLNDALALYQNTTSVCGINSGTALLDGICEMDYPEATLDCFLNFHENFDHAIQLYISTENEFLYIQKNGDSPLMDIDNPLFNNDFENEIYKILCARNNNENYLLNSESENVRSSFFVTNFKNHLVNRSYEGINLNLNQFTENFDISFIIKNYKDGEALDLLDANAIEYTTVSSFDYFAGGVWPFTYNGPFDVVKIKYLNTNGDDCDYLEIITPNATDFVDLKNLFDSTPSLINQFVNNSISDHAALAKLPGCLFKETGQLCTIFKEQIPHLSWPNKPLAIRNILATSTDNQSTAIIDCFRDEELMEPYLKEYASSMQIFFLDDLVRRIYDAYPPLGTNVLDDPIFELTGNQTVGIGDLFENTFHRNSVITSHNNSAFIPFHFPLTYYSTVAEKEFNYFDYYPVHLEYDSEEPSNDFYLLPGSPIITMPNGVKVHANTLVPGMYMPYATLKYAANERAENIATTVNLASIAFGFAQFRAALQGTRLLLFRGLFGAAEVAVGTASLLLEESAFCESLIDPDDPLGEDSQQMLAFCAAHKKWLPAANKVLLAGAVLDIAVSSFRAAAVKYNNLTPTNKAKIEAYLISKGYKGDALLDLYRAIDLRVVLKNTFEDLHLLDPNIIDRLVDKMDITAAKFLDHSVEIKAFSSVEDQLKFFEDIENTLYHIDGIGYNFVNFTAGRVKAWNAIKNFDSSTDFFTLTKISNALENGVSAAKIQDDLGDIVNTGDELLKTKYIETLDDERFIVLRRGTDGSQELQDAAESGYLLSDAARAKYFETGGDLNAALSHADDVHAQWLDTFNGDINAYAHAHATHGTNMESIYGLKRTLVSTTSDGSIIDNFYTPGVGSKFIGVVEESSVIKQTLPSSTESEYLFIGGMNLLKKID